MSVNQEMNIRDVNMGSLFTSSLLTGHDSAAVGWTVER